MDCSVADPRIIRDQREGVKSAYKSPRIIAQKTCVPRRFKLISNTSDAYSVNSDISKIRDEAIDIRASNDNIYQKMLEKIKNF